MLSPAVSLPYFLQYAPHFPPLSSNSLLHVPLSSAIFLQTPHEKVRWEQKNHFCHPLGPASAVFGNTCSLPRRELASMPRRRRKGQQEAGCGAERIEERRTKMKRGSWGPFHFCLMSRRCAIVAIIGARLIPLPCGALFSTCLSLAARRSPEPVPASVGKTL